MALRVLSGIARRTTLAPVTMTSRAAMSVYKGGVPTKDEAATGKERVQLEAFKAGVEDPWDREAHYLADYPEGTGMTKAKPIEVPSSFDRRIIACSCEISENFISYMWLYKGEPRRCPCGVWFELKYRKPPHEIWTPEEMLPPKDGKIADMH
ncbi:cytochrome c oxidase subunit 5B, mitochondrial-like [Convolutriloba macropyga]|uniref:cytochrome c oxidase subunit 5B, mitochondrial-like n=1 Tax=Convolutriloba macropyga TaxID=536237 RepID=UPI003F51E4EB